MANKLVSVVVVAYNSSGTIIETLDSILNQTYHNIEIVVTDDCSKDDTVKVVRDWGSRVGTAVNVVEAPVNGGIPANVNKGIRASKGELIKVIAGDDLLMPNCIERLVDEYEKNDEMTIIQSKVEFFGDYTENNITYTEECYRKIKLDNQYRELIRDNFVVAPAVGLIRKKTFEEAGWYDERFKLLDDYPFYIKLSSMGYKFKLLEEELIRYRISGGSVSTGKSRRFVNTVVSFFFKDRLGRLLKEGMLGRAAYLSLRHAFMYVTRR